jgi:hypothetical protein
MALAPTRQSFDGLGALWEGGQMMFGRHLGGSLAVLAAVASLFAVGAAPVAAGTDTTVDAASLTIGQLSDWKQFRGSAGHRGWNQVESTLSADNVSDLQILWRDGAGFNSSPAVAGGVVYNGEDLRAFTPGCRADGGYCDPLWRGATGYPDWASPAVGGRRVYMQSLYGLFAFNVGCRSDGGKCSPVWTGTNADGAYGSPTLANGWLYVPTGHGQLQAYDTARCGSAGGTCSPDWVADTMGESHSSPAVANGVVYAVTGNGFLAAFPALCGTGGATCTPTWVGDLGGGVDASPAVANGFVYITNSTARAFVFKTKCSTGGGTCAATWTAQLGGWNHASPAVTDTTAYFVTGRRIYAYAVGCVTSGRTCKPLWQSGRHPVGGGYASSPAIANGVLYIGSQGKYQQNGRLLAFDANCATDGSVCLALWRSAPLGGMVNSSPAVSHGQVYIASNLGGFYAFGLPPTP